MPNPCPRDGTELALLRERGKVCHRCPHCCGYLITLPLLRRLLSRTFVNEVWNRAREGGNSEGNLLCPRCRQAMAAVRTPAKESTPEIELDVCSRCQHVWLDAGEIEAVPAKPEPSRAPKKAPLSREAAEAVARFELKSLEDRQTFETELDASPQFDSWIWHIPHALGFPVATGPRAKRFHPPWVTLAVGSLLVAVFVVAYGEMVGSFDEFIAQYALIPAQWQRDGGITLLTSFFLHADWIHLIGNVYFFLLAAVDTEGRLGALRMVALIAAATLVGDFAHILWEPRSEIPTVGASGGIAGVLAYWALTFPRKRLNFFILGHRRWSATTHSWNIPIPVPYALVLWLGLQGFLAWLQVSEVSDVSALAHLGGASVGCLAYFGERALRRSRLSEIDRE